MDRKVAFRCSVRLHSRFLRPFSDSFKAKFAFWGFSEVELPLNGVLGGSHISGPEPVSAPDSDLLP
jgi:hypothetical protein